MWIISFVEFFKFLLYLPALRMMVTQFMSLKCNRLPLFWVFREGLSTRPAASSDEIQLQIDPMQGDLDDEIVGLHSQVKRLRNVSEKFFSLIYVTALYLGLLNCKQEHAATRCWYLHRITRNKIFFRCSYNIGI